MMSKKIPSISQHSTHDNTMNTKPMLFLTTDQAPTDNYAWGETMKPKSENTSRLYFQNINRLQSNINWNKWQDIVYEMHTNQVDIFGMAETNIN